MVLSDHSIVASHGFWKNDFFQTTSTFFADSMAALDIVWNIWSYSLIIVFNAPFSDQIFDFARE